MITQLGKSWYIMPSNEVGAVVQRLRAAGYHDTPYWKLLKDGMGLIISPVQAGKKLHFNIVAHELVWQQYGDLLEQEDVGDVIAALRRVGWSDVNVYCLTGDKTVIYITEDSIGNKDEYHLEIKGFRHQPVRDILESIGVAKEK